MEGYSILTAATDTNSCEGVSLLWREGNLFELENGKVRGPNTVMCKVQTGEAWYYVVGCYMPPSYKERKKLYDIVDAMNKMPGGGGIPMLLGDLNVNLDVPRNEQEAKVATAMDHHGMTCASKDFTVRQQKQCKLWGRWMWKQRRLLPGGPGTERIYRTNPDYFLMLWRERRRLKRCRFTARPTHSIDHRALVAQIYAGGKGSLKAYRRKLG